MMSRFSVLRTCAFVLAAGVLAAGCSGGSGPATDQVPAQTQPARSGAAVARNADGAVYAVDMDQSEIYWRIYRAGAAARFGHNHVISVEEADGRVYRAAELSDSTFELNIPVARLVVDDQDIRNRYGEDFATPPSQEDIDGTHTNMLSEDLLHGARYPELSLVGRDIRGAAGDMSMDLDIDIAGREVTVTVPVSLTEDEQRIVAEGEFRLSHGDLGLTAFSIMMGALRVADEIDFTYRIIALRSDR
jgi:polyisoprenoid-binding protein YceI